MIDVAKNMFGSVAHIHGKQKSELPMLQSRIEKKLDRDGFDKCTRELARLGR